MKRAGPLDWRQDRDAVLKRISGVSAPVKIILKVKNDPLMLEDWISYHARHFGAHSLIVFDNSSDMTMMHEKINHLMQEGILVVRFEGFHNNIHNTEIFGPLYQQLNSTCEYFVFLDADERLTYISDNIRSEPDQLILALRARPDITVWPGTWMYNARGSQTIFRVGNSPQTLLDGLKWGKPVIKAGSPITGFINHNSQLKQASYLADNPTNVFVLHMANLNKEQRIRSNIAKLQARKVITSEADFEELLRSDLPVTGDSNVRLYINEIRRLRAMEEVAQTELQQGNCVIDDHGSIRFYGSVERDVLAFHLGDFGRRHMRQMASL